MEGKMIYDKIKSKSQFSQFDDGLIKRVCDEKTNKYKKEKECIKAVKKELRLIYGRFYPQRCHQKAYQIVNDLFIDEKVSVEQLLSILELHVSTSERIKSLREFYDYINNEVENVTSILDVGCGFNPFCIPFMRFTSLDMYYAFDINKTTCDLLNLFFDKLNIMAIANTIDLISTVPKQKVDLVFLLKILPILEFQKKGISRLILKKLNANYVVVTYPIKSMSGKEKGMINYYEHTFRTIVDEKYIIKNERVIGDELVFILKKFDSGDVL